MSACRIITTMDYLNSLEDLSVLKDESIKVLTPDTKIDIDVYNKVVANNIRLEFIKCTPEDGTEFNMGWVFARTLQGNNAAILLTKNTYKQTAMFNKRGVIAATLAEGHAMLDEIEKQLEAEKQSSSSDETLAVTPDQPRKKRKYTRRKKLGVETAQNIASASTDTNVNSDGSVDASVNSAENNSVEPVKEESIAKSSEIMDILYKTGAVDLVEKNGITPDALYDDVIYCVNLSSSKTMFDCQIDLRFSDDARKALAKPLYNKLASSFDILKREADKLF